MWSPSSRSNTWWPTGSRLAWTRRWSFGTLFWRCLALPALCWWRPPFWGFGSNTALHVNVFFLSCCFNLYCFRDLHQDNGNSNRQTMRILVFCVGRLENSRGIFSFYGMPKKLDFSWLTLFSLSPVSVHSFSCIGIITRWPVTLHLSPFMRTTPTWSGWSIWSENILKLKKIAVCKKINSFIKNAPLPDLWQTPFSKSSSNSIFPFQ